MANGQSSLVLEYGRPWEPSTSPKRFEVRVRTRGPFTGKHGRAPATSALSVMGGSFSGSAPRL